MKTIVPTERYYSGQCSISEFLHKFNGDKVLKYAVQSSINSIVAEFLRTQGSGWLGKFLRLDFFAVLDSANIGTSILKLRLGVRPVNGVPPAVEVAIREWWTHPPTRLAEYTECTATSVYHPVDRLAVREPRIAASNEEDFLKWGPTFSDHYFTVDPPMLLRFSANSYNKDAWQPGGPELPPFNMAALCKLFQDPFEMVLANPNARYTMVVAFSEATFIAYMDTRHVLMGIFANVCTTSVAGQGNNLIVPKYAPRSLPWDDRFIVANATMMGEESDHWVNKMVKQAEKANKRVFKVSDIIKDLGENDAT